MLSNIINPMHRVTCSLDTAEERISAVEDRSGENPERSKERLTDGKYGEDKGIKDTMKKFDICIWSPQRREGRAQVEAIFEAIMAEKFPKTDERNL